MLKIICISVVCKNFFLTLSLPRKTPNFDENRLNSLCKQAVGIPVLKIVLSHASQCATSEGFLAHQLRISAYFTCTYKSYLTHVISPLAG